MGDNSEPDPAQQTQFIGKAIDTTKGSPWNVVTEIDQCLSVQCRERRTFGIEAELFHHKKKLKYQPAYSLSLYGTPSPCTTQYQPWARCTNWFTI